MRLGQRMPDEQRARTSAAMKVVMADPEVRAKISICMKGITKSPEWLANIAVAMTGKPCTNQSIEARAKMSASHWRGGRQVSNAKHTAQRRALGLTPLNSWFTGCEGHHIDNEQVIYMPKALHRSIYHRQSDGRGMEQINALAVAWLTSESIQ